MKLRILTEEEFENLPKEPTRFYFDYLPVEHLENMEDAVRQNDLEVDVVSICDDLEPEIFENIQKGNIDVALSVISGLADCWLCIVKRN